MGCSPSKKLQKNPEAYVKVQIQEMIDLLETGDLGQFISTYAHPEDLEKIKGDESLDEIVEDFSKNKAQLLLTALKDALEGKPEFNDQKTRAIFKSADVYRPLILERVESQWYIRN